MMRPALQFAPECRWPPFTRTATDNSCELICSPARATEVSDTSKRTWPPSLSMKLIVPPSLSPSFSSVTTRMARSPSEAVSAFTLPAKYSDQGSQIAVVVELTPQELRFTVRDSGIGLTPASIPMLFEMFSQVDSAIDRAEGGLGIGLALVKGLIALHGGTVDAASEGPGRGSTFTIHLPRSLAAPSLPGAGATAPAVSATVGWGCSVLVADDNRDAADSLAQLLNASGHVTHVAYSGGQALDIALREHPDACILDIGMPEMTGYEVAERIRAASRGRDVMLIAVTGWGQQEDKLKAEAAGFDHHLTKPVEPGAVEMLLHQFASRA